MGFMHATPGDMKSFKSSAESMALMLSGLRRSGGDQAGRGSDCQQESEAEAPTHQIKDNRPDFEQVEAKKHLKYGLQEEAILPVVEHSPIVGSHFSAENQWHFRGGRSDAAAHVLARPRSTLTLVLPQHSIINILQAAYCASFSLVIRTAWPHMKLCSTVSSPPLPSLR
jgi:hypothetical protein